MQIRSVKQYAFAAAFTVVASSGMANTVHTPPVFSTLYAFQGGSDGANPHATFLFTSGAVYGVTTAAGAGSGTFFSLAGTQSGWIETPLLSFVADGTSPSGDLSMFKTGFVGTKIGANSPGSLFQLKLTATVPSVWKELDIHSFTGTPSDGFEPADGMTKLAPDFYGVTMEGGTAGCQGIKGTGHPDGCGIVYKVVPPAKPGDPFAESVLYSFAGGADGSNPGDDLFEYKGNLYGTTMRGGAASCTTVADSVSGCGTFYEISPQGVKTTLYAFQGSNDGAGPIGKLFHVGTAFYGVTYYGGSTGCGGNGCGTVYRLKPPSFPGGPWIEKVLYVFKGGSDGAFPRSGLISYFGYLYGTTSEGGGSGCGGNGCGTVYAIKTTVAGVATIFHAFQGSDGAYPVGTLAKGPDGLVGSTEFGGDISCTGGLVLAGFPGCGTVYQIH